MERRLGKDVELRERYSKNIQDDFSKGYIVRVDKADCFKVSNPREWYLPHHPVINPNKPGKVRRVLNGAAKFQGSSLNRYAVSAEIEGMFLQVGVIQADRPSLRFLWREDPAADVAVFQYVRHIFGSKDSPPVRTTPSGEQRRITNPRSPKPLKVCLAVSTWMTT